MFKVEDWQGEEWREQDSEGGQVGEEMHGVVWGAEQEE
jgi:hypothetical protein